MRSIKNILTFFLLLLSVAVANAQNAAVENFVNEGIKLHDKKDYEGAVVQFRKALLLDPRSAFANYEIANSYLALKKYEATIAHSNKVIAARRSYVDQAYILKGSALDLAGKPAAAMEVYKEGIKKFGNNHLLYYNFALTAYKLKQYQEAALALQRAVKIDPSHASSHLLLGNIMTLQEHRVKSLLALFNFLLLEPSSSRSAQAYDLLEEQFKKGLKNDGGKPLVKTPGEIKEDEEFTTAALMLNLLESSRNNEANKTRPAIELFVEYSNTFFSILGELKKDKHGFWWDTYVAYYDDLVKNNHTEAFIYYISQLKNIDLYKSWYETNLPKLEAFSTWHTKYERK